MKHSTTNEVLLSSLKVGEKATIKSFTGGSSAKQRLIDMGLTVGTEVDITKCAPFSGPVCLCVRDSCLAIGHGLASKIIVTKNE